MMSDISLNFSEVSILLLFPLTIWFLTLIVVCCLWLPRAQIILHSFLPKKRDMVGCFNGEAGIAD